MLEGILSESKKHYFDAKKNIEEKIASLPKGSIKERRIYGRRYYYLQYRDDKRIVHKYLGKNNPAGIIRLLEERKALSQELKKVDAALEIIKKSETKK